MEKEPYSVRQAKALNFVSVSISRIYRDAPRKALELRAACESYHAEKLKEFDISLTLEVLWTACESGMVSSIVMALSTIEFMISYGCFNSEYIADPAKREKACSTVVTNVCRCSEFFDEKIDLQILKVLLAAHSSPSFLLTANFARISVSTCFKIVVGSEAPMIEGTGIATLTQILEKIAEITEDGDIDDKEYVPRQSDSSTAEAEKREDDMKKEPLSDESTAASKKSEEPGESQNPQGSTEEPPASTSTNESNKASSEQLPPKADTVQSSEDTDVTVEGEAEGATQGTSTDQDENGNEGTLADSNNGRESKDDQVTTEDKPSPESSKVEAAIEDAKPTPEAKDTEKEGEESQKAENSDEKEQDSEDAKASTTTGANPQLEIHIPEISAEKAPPTSLRALGSSGRAQYENGAPDKKRSLGEMKAVAVFQAVCSFAIKDVSGDLVRKSHTIALKLLKLLLEKGSDYFCELVVMDHTVREYLVSALLRNTSTSFEGKASPPAYSIYSKFVGGNENSLSIEILLLIVLRLRHALKLELGMLIPTIVLQPLEELSLTANENENLYEGRNSSNGSHSEEWSNYSSSQATAIFDTSRNMACIDFLRTVSKESQILVDVFVNYDCDWEGQNLYERIVKALAKAVHVSGGRAEFGKKAIEASHSFLKSLTFWGEAGGEPDDHSDTTSETQGSAHGASEVVTPRSVPTPRSAQQQVFRNASSLEEERNRKISLAEGISIFNRKPIKGIACLQKSGHLGSGTAKETATFLKSMSRKSTETEGNDLRISLTAMGDYFGSPEEDAIAALNAFVRLIDFKNMRLDEAVRRLLTYFRLPGEAQKIDRIMEALSVKYVEDNPNEFQNSDAPYVLSYSIMMLNTDAHNPMLTNRMSKTDFISNLADIKALEGVDREMIEGIYDRVTENEIKMIESDTSSAAGKDTGSMNNRKSLASIFGLLGLNESKRREASDEVAKVPGIIKKTRDMLKQLRPENAEEGQNKYITTTGSLLARPMSQVACPIILQALLYLLGFESSDGLSSPSSPSSTSPVTPPARQQSLQMSQMRRLPTEKVIDILDSLAHHGVVHNLSSITECSLLAMAYITAVDFPPRMQPHYSARAVQLLMHRAEYDAHKFSGVAWVILLEVISRVEALVGGQTEFTQASEGGRGISEKSTLNVPLSVVEAGGCALLSPHCVSIGPDSESTDPKSPTAEADDLADEQVFSGTLPSTITIGNVSFAFRFPPPASRFIGLAGENGRHSGPGSVEPNQLFVSWSSRSPEISVRLAEIATACRGQDWIQRVFERSITLDTVGLVSFTTALATISRRELLATGGPRLFSLQKLVEVGHANIPRIRLVWGRVWQVLSKHCKQVALHCDLKVAMYAVDSLKQLASSFLSRDSGYDASAEQKKDSALDKASISTNTIHSDVIRPFGGLISKSEKADIKELALHCIQNFASAYGAHLPGQAWAQIFRAIQGASNESSVSVVSAARRVLSSIIVGQDGIGANKDSDDCKGCQFLKQTSVAKSCLGDCLGCVNSHVARGIVGEEKVDDIVKLYIEIGRHISVYKGFEIESVEVFWMPLQASMASASSEGHVRENVLTALLGLLERFGGRMPDFFWRQTFQLIFFPAVDPILHDILEGNDVEKFLLNISNALLKRLALVIANSLPASSTSISSFLELVRRLVCSAGQGGDRFQSQQQQQRRRQPSVKVVATALNAVLELVKASQGSLQESEWEQIVSASTELLNTHIQTEKSPDAATPAPNSLEADVIIMVLKLVISLLRDQSEFLSTSQKNKLVMCIREAFYTSFEFNNAAVKSVGGEQGQSASVEKSGSDGSQVEEDNKGSSSEMEGSTQEDQIQGPSVQLQMRQEIEAGSALLAFSSQGETAVTLDIFGDALTQLYDDILAEYARSITCLHQSPAESDGVYSSMDKFNVLRQLVEMRTSLVVQTLTVLRKSPLFEKRKAQFLQYLSKIILTDQLNIRREISQIFSEYFEGV